MNGIAVEAERDLDFAGRADPMIIGRGIKTRDIANDAALLARLELDPTRQLIGARCFGALLLARLGLLPPRPAPITSPPPVAASPRLAISRDLDLLRGAGCADAEAPSTMSRRSARRRTTSPAPSKASSLP